MTEKQEKIEQMANFLSKNPDFLEKFKDIDAKALTQPSVLLQSGIEELSVYRLSTREVEEYLLMHPVIPRGIDIKANRMTGRGYEIVPVDKNDQVAVDAANQMEKLLMDSGGEILLNSWIKDAYAFGNGYLTLLNGKDSESDEIVYLSKEHPMFFRIARYAKDKAKKTSASQFLDDTNKTSDFSNDWGPMKVDPATKKPIKYTQVIWENQEKKKVVPTGTELDKNRVAHLVFDTWGDEAEGIGLVQYVHLILKYLMNIEEAGAEAIYRSGFTQKAIQTTIKTEKDLKKLAKHLKGINAADALILPDGTTVNNLQPGQNQFSETHEIFLNLIAIRLGIPKPILTLDGTDTNKATMRELMRDLIYDIHADEAKVKRTIEEQIFEPACKSIFGDEFEKFPIFEFKDFDEGKEEKANVLDITAKYVKSLTESAKTLAEMGQEDASNTILEFMKQNLPVEDLVAEKDNKEKTVEKIPEKGE